MLELSPVEANMCSLSALTFIMVKFPFRVVFSTFLLLSIMAWRQEGVAEAVGVKMSCYFIHEAAPTCSKSRKRKKKGNKSCQQLIHRRRLSEALKMKKQREGQGKMGLLGVSSIPALL